MMEGNSYLVMTNRIKLEKQNVPDDQVQELILDNCYAPQIKGLTEQFVNLQSLSMINVGLLSLEGFPRLLNLRKLELCDNKLTNGLISLKNSPNLTDLNLSGNNFRAPDSLKPLRLLQHLSNLDVYNCDLTKEDSDYKRKVFELLPNLQSLDGYSRNEEPQPLYYDDVSNTMEDNVEAADVAMDVNEPEPRNIVEAQETKNAPTSKIPSLQPQTSTNDAEMQPATINIVAQPVDNDTEMQSVVADSNTVEIPAPNYDTSLSPKPTETMVEPHVQIVTNQEQTESKEESTPETNQTEMQVEEKVVAAEDGGDHLQAQPENQSNKMAEPEAFSKQSETDNTDNKPQELEEAQNLTTLTSTSYNLSVEEDSRDMSANQNSLINPEESQEQQEQSPGEDTSRQQSLDDSRQDDTSGYSVEPEDSGSDDRNEHEQSIIEISNDHDSSAENGINGGAEMSRDDDSEVENEEEFDDSHEDDYDEEESSGQDEDGDQAVEMDGARQVYEDLEEGEYIVDDEEDEEEEDEEEGDGEYFENRRVGSSSEDENQSSSAEGDNEETADGGGKEQHHELGDKGYEIQIGDDEVADAEPAAASEEVASNTLELNVTAVSVIESPASPDANKGQKRKLDDEAAGDES